MNDLQWDKKLKITTTGRDDYHADEYNYPYEPTPYNVLERLVESKYITKENIVVDYGCGKGRVGFFLNYMIGCNTVGIEFDRKLYQLALTNLDSYIKKNSNYFECINAVNYRIENEDCFYFFNPFSIEILQSVIGRIRSSYYENPREMKLFFYYPSEEYIAYLMTVDELMFDDEIDCSDLFEGNNNRERIMIYTIQ